MNPHDARLLNEAYKHINPPLQNYNDLSQDQVIEVLIADNEERGKTASHRSLALYHILLDMIGEQKLAQELWYVIDEFPKGLKELAVERGVVK